MVTHPRCGLAEPLDRREQHWLHRASSWLVCALAHEEPYEPVQLCVVAYEQQFVLQAVPETVKPEWVWSAGVLVLPWSAGQSQSVGTGARGVA